MFGWCTCGWFWLDLVQPEPAGQQPPSRFQPQAVGSRPTASPALSWAQQGSEI